MHYIKRFLLMSRKLVKIQDKIVYSQFLPSSIFLHFSKFQYITILYIYIYLYIYTYILYIYCIYLSIYMYILYILYTSSRWILNVEINSFIYNTFWMLIIVIYLYKQWINVNDTLLYSIAQILCNNWNLFLENYSQATFLCIEKKLFRISIIYFYIDIYIMKLCVLFYYQNSYCVKFNIIKCERFWKYRTYFWNNVFF